MHSVTEKTKIYKSDNTILNIKNSVSIISRKVFMLHVSYTEL